MKKILLAAINAKYIHSNLAIYDLQAYVKDLPINVELGEYTINQQRFDILQAIYEEKADIVAFSCYIWNIDIVLTLAEELSKVAPDTRIWLGGPEASYDAERILKENPAIDLVMIGEGELTFRHLLEKEINDEQKNKISAGNESVGNKMEGIAGTAYRQKEKDGEEIIISKPSEEFVDMDTIPFVYENIKKFEHKIIYYETSRGCPFRCSYCLSSIDKRVRFRSLSLVFEELQKFLDQKVPQVKFVDRTFNCVHEHAYAIWKYILEHDNQVTNFHFEISADLLKEEDFQLFEQMRPGLIQLEIGVQSTNPETIKAICRTMNLEQLKQNVLRIHEMKNIHQHLDLIAGLPYETLEIFKKSFNEVYAMKPDQLQLGFLKVLKGSMMDEQQKEYSLAYTTLPPYEVLCTKWLSFEDVLSLKGVEEMVEVYYNSGQFTKILSNALPYFKDAYTFYEMLWHYYKENGLFERKHTRLARYEILYWFLLQIIEDEKTIFLFKECLLWDIYITEHSKKRPEFAEEDFETKKILNQLRNPAWCKEHLSEENQKQLKETLKNRTDIHLEHFSYLYENVYLLFDYRTRHPLTNQANVVMLEIFPRT